MRLRIAPKIVIRVSTVLTLSVSLVYASVSRGAHTVNIEFANQESDRPLSPRLAALQDRLKAGDRNALDSFWKEITESGAPIIEGVSGNDREVLVTMLWRAKEETRNVFVFRLGDVSKSMVRLLDTDLWYKTFRLQKGARFIYQFATNLPDPKTWRGVTQFASAVRTDPLNPLQYSEHANELNPYEGWVFSALELPSAAPQSWIAVRPNVPTGRVQRDKFTSKLLSNERQIWIYTPHDFSVNKKPYGLLVLTDGALAVNTARVATTLDNLIAAGLIPPLVAVMVDNPARFRELSCNSEYADFLAQEIVPWARANYHATDRPEQTIIGGTSLGGLQAFCVGLKHSEVFGNVLSQSGDLGWKPNGEKEWEWLNRQFAAGPRLPLRFSFEAGLMEGTWWWRDLMLQQPNPPPANSIDPTFLAANRNMRDTLQSRGYSVHYTEYNGNHGSLNWRGTLASHLIALVGIKPEPKISSSSKDAVAASLLLRKADTTSEVRVPSALLKSYVGRYQLDPQFTKDFVIYVGVKNDSLWVKPSSLTARRVMAESESRFYDSEIPDLHLAFIKDEKGNVTGLTLKSETGDVWVKKMPPPVPSVTGNTTFKLPGHTDAEAVAIYGSFNNWIQTKNYCAKEVDGWVCRVDLAPGKYTYKFLIDGVGLLDPTNSATEDDGQGHTDSVIVIKPSEQQGDAPRDEKGGQEIATTVDDRPLSPRLAALQDQLKAGDRSALDSFWKEITERGAPMIEPVSGSDRDVLVTILWRAKEETRNAFVFHLSGVDKPMARLLDTDLWYKTFQLQKGARFVYRLATNLPDPRTWTSLARFGNALRSDPLNPLQFAERANELNPYEVNFYAAAELPTAESQFWSVARPKVPKGRVQRDKFSSKLLGNERPIWVYTPHGYAAGKKPYGLLVLSDGGGYVNSARVATTLDNLIAEGLISPLVAVMVDNPDRFRELCSLQYGDFLTQEIVPWARVNYRVTDKPEQTILGGASLGGWAAAFVGFKHPEVFGNILSQSGSFQFKCDEKKDWEWLTQQFAASPRLPLRFSLEAGLMENTGGGPAGQPRGPTLLVANRNLRDTLQSKGYSVHYTEFNGNHTMFNWRGTLASHLIALVGIKPEPKIPGGKPASVTRPTARKAVSTAEVKVAPALLKRYIGRYELDPKFTHDFVLYVSVKDNSLWVKPGYMRARPVMAESESRFYDSENPDLHVSFIQDEKGIVTGLNLNSEMGDIRVKKMPPPVPSVGNTTFKLAGHTDAEVVAIYGSFNNWIQTKNYCAKEADGWVCRIDLAPGKYTYRFLVDGVGLLDPNNSASEDDGQGHIDSVIVIKPK